MFTLYIMDYILGSVFLFKLHTNAILVFFAWKSISISSKLVSQQTVKRFELDFMIQSALSYLLASFKYFKANSFTLMTPVTLLRLSLQMRIQEQSLLLIYFAKASVMYYFSYSMKKSRAGIIIDSTLSVRSQRVEVSNNFSVFFRNFQRNGKSYIIVQESSKVLMLNPLMVMNSKHPVESFCHWVDNNPEQFDHNQNDRTCIVCQDYLVRPCAVGLRNDLCDNKYDKGREKNGCPVRHEGMHYQRKGFQGHRVGNQESYQEQMMV